MPTAREALGRCTETAGAVVMKRIIRATDQSYREHIQGEDEGRLPLASLTFGKISGYGWGFLHPWEQQALFPAKGTPRGIGHPDRYHAPFIIFRWRSFNGVYKHPNQDWYIEGRYWHGYVWRSEWGLRWGFWPKFKNELLDPDIVTHDPGQAEDW